MPKKITEIRSLIVEVSRAGGEWRIGCERKKGKGQRSEQERKQK